VAVAAEQLLRGRLHLVKGGGDRRGADEQHQAQLSAPAWPGTAIRMVSQGFSSVAGAGILPVAGRAEFMGARMDYSFRSIGRLRGQDSVFAEKNRFWGS
jgi:hypothetical protein